MKLEPTGKDAETADRQRATAVKIDEDTHAMLRRAAQVRGITMGELVAEAVREYVARHPVTVTA